MWVYSYSFVVKFDPLDCAILVMTDICAVQEQFDPIVDADTDIDFIPSMIYG